MHTIAHRFHNDGKGCSFDGQEKDGQAQSSAKFGGYQSTEKYEYRYNPILILIRAINGMIIFLIISKVEYL